MRASKGVNRRLFEIAGQRLYDFVPNATLCWRYSIALIGPRCRLKGSSAASPAAASGATAGLLRVFASGEGQSAARGTISGGQLVPATYASRIVTGDKSDEVRMVISAGTVKELTANPPTVASPDRVAVTEAHRRGVSDPMTASLVRVPGSGDTLVPQACQRTLSIFDGRMRYDLQLAFKRLDRVSSDRGYQGLAVVCAVSFSPIAGHVPERYAIKYLIQLRD